LDSKNFRKVERMSEAFMGSSKSRMVQEEEVQDLRPDCRKGWAPAVG
jgi:hypothetical protein